MRPQREFRTLSPNPDLSRPPQLATFSGMVRLFKAFFLLTVLAFQAPLQSDAMIRQSALPDTYTQATCLAVDARTRFFPFETGGNG